MKSIFEEWKTDLLDFLRITKKPIDEIVKEMSENMVEVLDSLNS